MGARTIFCGPCLFNVDGSAVPILSIELLDRQQRIAVMKHIHKCKPPRLPHRVALYRHSFDIPPLLEAPLKLGLTHIVRQIRYKNSHKTFSHRNVLEPLGRMAQRRWPLALPSPR